MKSEAHAYIQQIKLMSTFNYFRAIDCEYDAANRNESFRKGQWSGKRKLIKNHLYISQFM